LPSTLSRSYSSSERRTPESTKISRRKFSLIFYSDLPFILQFSQLVSCSSISSLSKLLDKKYEETGLNVNIHGQSFPFVIPFLFLAPFRQLTNLSLPLSSVDAASGGFVAPFVNPDLLWDFRVKRVVCVVLLVPFIGPFAVTLMHPNLSCLPVRSIPPDTSKPSSFALFVRVYRSLTSWASSRLPDTVSPTQVSVGRSGGRRSTSMTLSCSSPVFLSTLALLCASEY
jgi:hypothetical protein